jgi:hypothetical protein
MNEVERGAVRDTLPQIWSRARTLSFFPFCHPLVDRDLLATLRKRMEVSQARAGPVLNDHVLSSIFESLDNISKRNLYSVLTICARWKVRATTGRTTTHNERVSPRKSENRFCIVE